MDEVFIKIKEIAKNYNIQKVILFGSRARGDNSPVSDYDIAVYKLGMTVIDESYFCDEHKGY